MNCMLKRLGFLILITPFFQANAKPTSFAKTSDYVLFALGICKDTFHGFTNPGKEENEALKKCNDKGMALLDSGEFKEKTPKFIALTLCDAFSFAPKTQYNCLSHTSDYISDSVLSLLLERCKNVKPKQSLLRVSADYITLVDCFKKKSEEFPNEISGTKTLPENDAQPASSDGHK